MVTTDLCYRFVQGRRHRQTLCFIGSSIHVKGARERSDTMNISTIIFDVDDTLYDASNGFTEHRTGPAVQQFMVDHLDFPDLKSAKALWEEYFERYHSTVKALTVAEQEGRFPPPKDPATSKTPRFETDDLATYWATKLDFNLLGGRQEELIRDLNDCPLVLVAFSNGPRTYVKRVLQELGLFDIFGEHRLFAVDDVLPNCKPERQAFQTIFKKLGVHAEECVMVEDSMKNIRAAKALNIKTVLVAGARTNRTENALLEGDPAVDVAIETVKDMRSVLPGLWETPAVFAPISCSTRCQE
jgi:putative hydrolase of the HAD superfamily